MIQTYYPVGLMMVLAAGLGIVFLLLFRLLGPYAPNKLKATSYECGIEPQGDVRHPLSVRYYVVAMVFVVFDIEVVFLYPWAVQVEKFGVYGFIEMMLFVAILLVGLVYIWKKGVLSWQK
jgi:NADH-quinone oxidoreductase subunit A